MPFKMLLNILRQTNWLDIITVIALFRICYIAMDKGLLVEFFKLLGTISALYLSMHYYTPVSDFFRERIDLEVVPLKFLDFIFFALLGIISYLIFVLLRSVCQRFVKVQIAPRLNKWAGLVLGLARAYLFIGLVIYMLAISSVIYLEDSVVGSYLGMRCFKIAPKTYSWIWNSIASKFMKREKFNNTVLEIQEDFTQE
jgi:uncharacterized membrane protein required for colicin V production